jgi:hypothetical protein
MNPVSEARTHDVSHGPSAAPASEGDGRASVERRDLERRIDALRSAFLRSAAPHATSARARIPLERVDLELWRVHQIEAARALAEAARLAGRADQDRDAHERDLHAWRARTRDLLESARACEARLPRVLARCATRAREEWPTAQRLLRAALRLDPSAALRAELDALLERVSATGFAREAELRASLP